MAFSSCPSMGVHSVWPCAWWSCSARCSSLTPVMFPHHWAAQVRRSVLFSSPCVPLFWDCCVGSSLLPPSLPMPCRWQRGPPLVLRSASFAGVRVFLLALQCLGVASGFLERVVSSVAAMWVNCLWVNCARSLMAKASWPWDWRSIVYLVLAWASDSPTLRREDVWPWVFSARRGAFTGFFFHQRFVLGWVKCGGIEA